MKETVVALSVSGQFAASLFVGLVSFLACAEDAKISGRTVLPELPNVEITRWVDDQPSSALVDSAGQYQIDVVQLSNPERVGQIARISMIDPITFHADGSATAGRFTFASSR